MGVSRVIQPSSASAFFAETPASMTSYSTSCSLKAGVYEVSCVSTTVATVSFFAGTTHLITAVTVSGSVTVNLSQNATSIVYGIDTGTDVTIGIQATGQVLPGGSSGTVDTLTSTQTYTETGFGQVFIISGGSGGYSGTSAFSSDPNFRYGGTGGKTGARVGPIGVYLDGSVSVVIGAGGVGGVAANSSSGPVAGGAGGTTSFGNLEATVNGDGSVNGGSGGFSVAGAAGSVTLADAGKPITTATTGSGGGGGGQHGNFGNVGGTGGSGNIGTGGNGGSSNGTNGNNANAANGYGAGGGGGGGAKNKGGDGGSGSQGVIYVVRFT